MKHKSNKKFEEAKSGVKKIGRTVYFFDEVNEETVCEAMIQINLLEDESKKPIQFVICSGGGNCYDGFALYDKLRNSECQIVTVGTGIVASMALTLFLAGDERLVTESTRLMHHEVATYFEGKFSAMEVDYKETKILEAMLLDVVVARTGKSLASLKQERLKGDKFLSASEAIKEGYAHRVIINKTTVRRKKK